MCKQTDKASAMIISPPQESQTDDLKLIDIKYSIMNLQQLLNEYEYEQNKKRIDLLEIYIRLLQPNTSIH